MHDIGIRTYCHIIYLPSHCSVGSLFFRIPSSACPPFSASHLSASSANAALIIKKSTTSRKKPKEFRTTLSPSVSFVMRNAVKTSIFSEHKDTPSLGPSSHDGAQWESPSFEKYIHPLGFWDLSSLEGSTSHSMVQYTRCKSAHPLAVNFLLFKSPQISSLHV